MDATTDEEITNALQHEALSGRWAIDGLPTRVSTVNREDFVNLYSRHTLLISRKPYLDQLIVGLNHYGVSIK